MLTLLLVNIYVAYSPHKYIIETDASDLLLYESLFRFRCHLAWFYFQDGLMWKIQVNLHLVVLHYLDPELNKE